MSGILLKVRGKNIVRKSGQKLLIVGWIFAFVQVFSSIQLVLAWYEYHFTMEGVPRIVKEYHSVCMLLQASQ